MTPKNCEVDGRIALTCRSQNVRVSKWELGAAAMSREKRSRSREGVAHRNSPFADPWICKKIVFVHLTRYGSRSRATELLRAGTPLVEIGQLLRHRSQLTTAIYAKVDRVALRTLARPWPRGVA